MSQNNDKNPTIVIVNGANWLGAKLVETLTENSGNVIVIDDFCEENLPFIKKFSENKRFVFIERDKIKSIKDNFTKIKYFIHLKNDLNSKDDDVSSKQFIAETKFVDEVLTLALEKNSSYILVSSIHLHKDFVLRKNFTRTGSAYTESDLQDYIERTVLEYHQKAGLNARVARLGNVYGPEMDLSKDPILMQILTDAFYSESIRVYGDGLEFMYYVYISDAIQGILKALFTPNATGQVYSLTNPDEISILSIVNKILSFQPRAKKIKFLAGKTNINPLYEKAYIPDPNLSEIGWSPAISFDRGLASVYDFFRKDSSLDNSTQNPNTENSIQEELKFDFDNTLNLSNSFYGYNHNEGEQFKEFYRKLNNPDSPIYNSVNKVESYDPRKYLENVGAKETQKAGFLKLFIFSILILAFTSLILYPGLKIGILDVSIKSRVSKLKTLTNNTSADYSEDLNRTNFVRDFSESLMTVEWALNATGQSDKVKNYEVVLRGIDQSFSIYAQIRTNNLMNTINSSGTLSESDYLKLTSLMVDIKQAQSDLKGVSDLPISDLNESVSVINDWLTNLQDKISTRTNRPS